MSKPKETTIEVLMADALVRITAIQNLLISKNVFSQEEFMRQVEEIAKALSGVIDKTRSL
jgi:hypothetical protein